MPYESSLAVSTEGILEMRLLFFFAVFCLLFFLLFFFWGGGNTFQGRPLCCWEPLKHIGLPNTSVPRRRDEEHPQPHGDEEPGAVHPDLLQPLASAWDAWDEPTSPLAVLG